MRQEDKVRSMKMECDRLENLIRTEREDIRLQMKTSAMVIEKRQKKLEAARRDLIGLIKGRVS